MKRQGYVRVEAQVRKEDAELVRTIASALTDPAQAAEARAHLRKSFAEPQQGLKALLAAAPEGIDFERPRDTGRAIDLRPSSSIRTSSQRYGKVPVAIQMSPRGKDR